MNDGIYRMGHEEVFQKVRELAKRISDTYISRSGELKVYPIPRGGVPVVYRLMSHFPHMVFARGPDDATIFVDDIVDSGRTRDRYAEQYPGIPFYTLVDKQTEPDWGWVEFPWEVGDEKTGIEDNIVRLLEYIGEDPNRGGLLETPGRVARAWKDWTAGYGCDPKDVLKVFEDGGEDYDEMVLVRNISFYSHCEHHLAPFFGTADIAYVPNGKIVGLSKLSRLLEIFAKRLQVQERLTAQVADALMDQLQPKGAAVSIRARHLCMESRGIHKQGSETVTNALRGVFKDDAKARGEFLSIIKG